MTRIKYAVLMLVGMVATMASAATEEVASGSASSGSLWVPLAAGLGIALAVISAAMAQGRIASSYLESVSRNPSAQKFMFTPLILGLAFVETLVLFTVLIEMMVLGKV